MSYDDQPSPDELLRAIQKEEAQKSVGKLKVFFGMAAGVGKTFSMLEDAQRKLKEGVNVVIGTINTHGRKETEALVQGIPVVPEKWINYKGIAFSELDLEELLKLKPEIVLVDELAHTNVPGSKHPKRWQDVIELLDAGISVYTTLNVQHIESRKDIVESITGVQIRETVPDLILERATTIELVDLPPEDLLKRLKEGKVYLGDQSQIAAQNFFKEDNLTALREISLRLTAEKVDHDLHGFMGKGKGWKTREKLLAAISPSPSSQWVVRAARRLAFELDAHWIAIWVDTGTPLSDTDQSRLMSNLNLARDLGAEVITTHDIDIPTAINRIAQEKEITRIIIGRPPKKRWYLFWKEDLIERLEKENKNVDVIILRQEPVTTLYQRFVPSKYFTSTLSSYFFVFLYVIAFILIGYAAEPLVGYKSVGIIFLLGSMILGFFADLGPTLFGVILSALSWDFLFVEPYHAIEIHDPEDNAFVLIYFFTTALMALLTTRMRNQEKFLKKQQEKLEHLYEIQQVIANAHDVVTLRTNVTQRLQAILPGEFDILIKNSNDQFILDSKLPILQIEKERAVATWVFQNGTVAGWSTDTLPSAEAIYFPIKFLKTNAGVLVYHPKGNRPLSIEELNFIQTVTQQLGVFFARYLFEAQLHRQEYALQVEKLHNAIIHSLNRSFYSPVEGIIQINQQIKKTSADPNITVLCSKMERLMHSIKLTADNMIAISELDSGHVHFEKIYHSINVLVNQCIEEIKPLMNERGVEVQAPAQPIYISCDYNLIKLALKNLILNAAQFSPVSIPITIQLASSESEFLLSVVDHGPHIPEDILAFIFEKFYRSTSSKGMGLGLAVVRSVMDIHKGKIEVKNLEGGGTEFTLIFAKI
jgi:two-component system sensor histidine kinase KdpD